MKLPDISLDDKAIHAHAISWVGMEKIALPLQIVVGHSVATIATKIDVYVNLPKPNAKGIHMSRLYQAIGDLTNLNENDIYRTLKILFIAIKIVEQLLQKFVFVQKFHYNAMP